jgi:hypothetical protein
MIVAVCSTSFANCAASVTAPPRTDLRFNSSPGACAMASWRIESFLTNACDFGADGETLSNNPVSNNLAD